MSERALNWLLALVVVCALALFVSVFTIPGARAMNHGFDPNAPATKWFEKLMMPDFPEVSCCAKADAYPVDRFVKQPDGSYKAWVEDGSAIQFPDGSHREPFDVSEPITIPPNKVNSLDDDLDNPTEHGWVFMRVSGPREYYIYCFVRHPQGM
jgi:hypothetical protein